MDSSYREMENSQREENLIAIMNSDLIQYLSFM